MNTYMSKRNIIYALCILIIAGLVFLNFSGKGSDSVVHVGVSLALTGPNASIGERVKNGIDIAYTELSEEEKKHIKISYEDDKSNAKDALSAVNKLINIDKAVSVIGLIRSDQVLATAPTFNERHITLLSPTAGADEITTAGDYIFRNIETGEAHGEGASQFMQQNGIVSVGVFTGQAANAKTYSKHFVDSAEKKGMKTLKEVPYNAG